MALSGLKKLGMYTAAFALASTGLGVSAQNNAVSFTSPAQAAGSCFPGTYNPSRPVQPGDCFTMAEFNKAMVAEGQQPVLVGNRDAGMYKYGEYFTANSDGSKGVNAEMDVPYEQKTSAGTISIRAVYTNIKINDVNASANIPQWPELRTDNAKAREYCAKFNGACLSFDDYMVRNRLGATRGADARVMMVAQTVNSPTADGRWKGGQKIIVFRDMNDGTGDVSAFHSTGATTPLFPMEPVSYTQFANRFMGERHAANNTGSGRATAVAALALNN